MLNPLRILADKIGDFGYGGARERVAVVQRMEESYRNLFNDLSRDLHYQFNEFRLGLERFNTPYKVHDRKNLAAARGIANDLACDNPLARNFVGNFVNHTVGRGFAIEFINKNDETEFWEIAKRIEWTRRIREAARRIAVEGEAALRRFRYNEVRFVEAENIETPGEFQSDANVIEGVRIRPGDAETILGYYVGGEYVPARDIWHGKDLDSPMSAVRGWPILFDARHLFQQYEIFIKNRAILNQMRSAIGLFRKHVNKTGSQVKSFVDSVKAGTYPGADGKTKNIAAIPPAGTIIDHNNDIEYEFKAPNINSSDVAEDARAIRLLIPAFFNMPEFMMTADASNANFASTLVSESPFVKAMEAAQEMVGGELSKLIDFLMRRPVEKEFLWPQLVSRDHLKEAQANKIAVEAGAMSRRTFMQKLKLDPDEEMKQIEAESGMGDLRDDPNPVDDDEPDDDGDV